MRSRSGSFNPVLFRFEHTQLFGHARRTAGDLGRAPTAAEHDDVTSRIFSTSCASTRLPKPLCVSAPSSEASQPTDPRRGNFMSEAELSAEERLFAPFVPNGRNCSPERDLVRTPVSARMVWWPFGLGPADLGDGSEETLQLATLAAP